MWLYSWEKCIFRPCLQHLYAQAQRRYTSTTTRRSHQHHRQLKIAQSVDMIMPQNFILGLRKCLWHLHIGHHISLHSRSLRLCISSVRFLSSSSSSSSSVNISKSYIFDMAWPILTRLGHKYRLTIPFMSHDQIRVKGHVGVTGVKKVIFTKNATPPTNYVAWSCDLCMWKSLRPSTKVIFKNFDQRSFGGTGGKSNVHFSWIHSSILKKDMPLFHLSNDVQCSEALIRIKRLAEYTGYTIPQTADHRLQTADWKISKLQEGLTLNGGGVGKAIISQSK